MKDLQAYKLNNPEQRYERISSLLAKLQKSKVLDEIGLKINPDFTNVKAKQLEHPLIIDNQNKAQNWESYAKNQIKHSQPANFKADTWALIYSKKNFDDANLLYEQLSKYSVPLGVKLGEPQWVECPKGDTDDDFIKPIQTDIDPDVTKIVIVVLTKRELRPKIKKTLVEMGVISQFVMASTLS